jgi:hypothetical protein
MTITNWITSGWGIYYLVGIPVVLTIAHLLTGRK